MAFDEQTVERTFARYLRSPTICVDLATTGRSFHVHRALLEQKSDYFCRLLSSGLRESRESRVSWQWPSDFEKAFDAVVEYLYTDTYGQLPNAEPAQQCLEAAHVYVLADRLLMPELKAKALSVLGTFLAQDREASLHDGTTAPEDPCYSGFLPSSLKKPRQRKRIAIGIPDEDTTQPRPLPPRTIVRIQQIVYENELEIGQEDSQDGHEQRSGAETKSRDQSDDEVDEMQPSVTEDNSIDPRRDAQLLVAAYAARNIVYLRDCSELELLLARGGRFVLDVVKALR